jgi:predicted DNA-binding protein
MSAQITLTLPDDVMRRAELLARHTNRPVADVLAETLELSLNPLEALQGRREPMTKWTDEEVLKAADDRISEEEDDRFSELLDRQQAGAMSQAERTELAAFMERYQVGMLRKAWALREAVRRGLREPLQP